MLAVGLNALEHLLGHPQPGADVGAAAGADGLDPCTSILGSIVRADGNDLPRVVAECDHADQVFFVEDLERLGRGLVGDLLLRSRGAHDRPAHRARGIQHHNNRNLRHHQIIGHIELDGQDLLDRGTLPAARTERLTPTDKDHAPAQLLRVRHQQLFAHGREGIAGRVNEHHKVERFEIEQVLREVTRQALLDIPLLLVEHPLKLGALTLPVFEAGGDDQHSTTRSGHRDTTRTVVLQAGIAAIEPAAGIDLIGDKLGLKPMHAGTTERHRDEQHALAGRELHTHAGA